MREFRNKPSLFAISCAKFPMPTEHLRPLWDSHRDGERFWRVYEGFARAEMPIEVLQALRIGRMTAFCGGSLLAILSEGWSRTMARQLGPAVESATAPYQFALSTKAGSECVAHVAQALTDMDDSATLLSVDGMGVFDLVSRGAMMSGLLEVVHPHSLLSDSFVGHHPPACGTTAMG